MAVSVALADKDVQWGSMGIGANAYGSLASGGPVAGTVGVIAAITWDTSYPTGGEDLDPADFGLREILYVIPVSSGLGNFGANVSGLSVYYNPSTGKLLAYDANATEVANGTNLSTRGAYCLVIGRL